MRPVTARLYPQSLTTDAGLTLLETLITLSILGFMLGLSLSGLAVVENRRLSGAAHILASEMRGVEQRARTERRCWGVIFDPAGERYEVQSLEMGAARRGAGCAPGRGRRWLQRKNVSLPRSIDLAETTFPSNRLIFSPFGTPTAGEVILRTPRGARRIVAVTPLGRVTVGTGNLRP
jgi:Tfp pilus assembly protein FimT